MEIAMMQIQDLEDEKNNREIFYENNKHSNEKSESKKNHIDEEGLFGDINKNTNSVGTLAMSFKLLQFTDNVSMHGIRYIFRRDAGQIRRFIWLLIVLCGMGYCLYVVHETFADYYSYPTVTEISTTFEKKSKFPSVTFCNFNAFQKSRVTDEEASALYLLYGEEDILANTNYTLSQFNDFNVEEFVRRAAFNYTLGFCFYKGHRCNSSHFTEVITDHGICLNFDPSKDEEASYQTTAGLSKGLHLGEVLYPEEWTVGPHYQAYGFKVVIHPPGTKLYSIDDDGISLLPDLTTDIEITRKESTYLSSPHGECSSRNLIYFSEYSRKKCFLECKTQHVLNICGCRYFYMPGTSGVCTYKQQVACNALLLEKANLFDASVCDCPQDCAIITYTTRVSQTAPSLGFATALAQQFNVQATGTGVAVRVYYNSFQYTQEVEEEVYTTEKLLCDIGGAAGLFLGCSFVTLVEYLDFFFEFLWFWITKNVLMWKSKKQINPIH